MTTARSPLSRLRAQADEIAARLKAIERGDIGRVKDPAGKMAAARVRDAIQFAVVMDDKILKIEMPWATIRSLSEAGISEYIVKHMRESREATH